MAELVEQKFDKRYDYAVKFYAALANNKNVFYLDETKFNFKGKNIHVIAVIASTGLAYQGSHFGSLTSDLPNEFIRRFLRHIRLSTPLDEIVLVLDNAPYQGRF
ncbi:uncharacterized protein PITG_14548 [Phytophthora infestans T30-4]|uniref:Tc1-like transposase DDE domain-containing protein n=1 Tax=Phytophthora infestans (strain T30-4) TaxID=403677 RepID=D0NQ37_PHYIT|nr:uncharacterized protein PITG_14548 [Phytophthora infestans T30-4]EEY62749.1 conserved hypothetical protein [Phytophthora infestans T30-4]|eukprot:XP_002898991.1 conserved hypothetical protein [Phytophthora infestans T30-4]